MRCSTCLLVSFPHILSCTTSASINNAKRHENATNDKVRKGESIPQSNSITNREMSSVQLAESTEQPPSASMEASQSAESEHMAVVASGSVEKESKEKTPGPSVQPSVDDPAYGTISSSSGEKSATQAVQLDTASLAPSAQAAVLYSSIPASEAGV